MGSQTSCVVFGQACRPHLITVLTVMPTALQQKLLTCNVICTIHQVRATTVHRVAQKFGTIILYALTLPHTQNYFTTIIRKKFVIILSLKSPSHPKCVAALPCKMSSVLKATIENKPTSVTTHFKQLTTGNNVFIVSVIV